MNYWKKKGPAPPPPTSPLPSSSTTGSLTPSKPAFTSIFSTPPSSPIQTSAYGLRRNHSFQNPSSLLHRGTAATMEENDSWRLEDGVLRPLRESKTDLTVEEKVPLSPKPWYKRSLRDTTAEKKKKEKKGGSPENLPELHSGRESIKVQESFDDKYSYFTRKAILEDPHSHKHS